MGGCALSKDPQHRTIVGWSSGGLAAFNAAFQRPDAFGNVISHSGSYVGTRGGHNMHYMVRTGPRRTIRVFLTSGANDLTAPHGDWPLANHTMAKALEYKGYDVRYEFSPVGGHTLRFGGSLFAESIRWLVR